MRYRSVVRVGFNCWNASTCELCNVFGLPGFLAHIQFRGGMAPLTFAVRVCHRRLSIAHVTRPFGRRTTTAWVQFLKAMQDASDRVDRAAVACMKNENVGLRRTVQRRPSIAGSERTWHNTVQPTGSSDGRQEHTSPAAWYFPKAFWPKERL